MTKNYKPMVYICSPYSGEVEQNKILAREYCRYAVDENCIPIAPHLLFPQFMDEETERDVAMYMNFVLLAKCDELWVFGDKISEGMNLEIAKANQLGKTVQYIIEEGSHD